MLFEGGPVSNNRIFLLILQSPSRREIYGKEASGLGIHFEEVIPGRLLVVVAVCSRAKFFFEGEPHGREDRRPEGNAFLGWVGMDGLHVIVNSGSFLAVNPTLNAIH